MPQISKVIRALEAAKVREKVKVIVGGAPISSTLAKSVGAEGYAPDAGSAVDVIKSIMPSNS